MMEQPLKKKIKLYEEFVFLLAILLMSFAVSVVAAADFGVSMIVAPAYIVSLKCNFLSFGQAEYFLQGLVFIGFCILMRKVKPVYFFCLITCIVYGAVLDFWRSIIPAFNPSITPPGSFSMPTRIIMFLFGMILTSFSVALFFKVYLYPQVYDFFVKKVSQHFQINLTKFKITYDICSLSTAVILTLLFFGSFRGIGVGTLIMTACNGFVIRFFSSMLDKFVELTPRWEKIAKIFNA